MCILHTKHSSKLIIANLLKDSYFFSKCICTITSRFIPAISLMVTLFCTKGITFYSKLCKQLSWAKRIILADGKNTNMRA